MNSFAEFAAESYYSTVELSWGYKLASGAHAHAFFKVHEITVAVLFERRESAWLVSFSVGNGELTQAIHAAFAIFNGVFQAVREFMETRHPEALSFVAEQESLAHIYETYLRREQPAFEKLGYQQDGLQLRRVVASESRNN